MEGGDSGRISPTGKTTLGSLRPSWLTAGPPERVRLERRETVSFYKPALYTAKKIFNFRNEELFWLYWKL
ncbi:hypothetical protein NCCP2331_03960 [Sporosarcina sp. NCCP-2331]|nr:hypothetical protein NCCP2331_03960 [Sporosarcina sp. NCCP-2331]GLB54293.1 hypothetical protein NCCP2378_00780 [Sporosarcina sp. NCCP-2378]